ncbi:MAG: HdeA/HdeB family chaperone, partial [Stellaceae bacterium]
APPPPEAAASTAPIPIRTLSCAELLGASDDDRAAASMFFIGYQAARNNVHNLSIEQIQAIEGKALSICAAHQTMPAARAFQTAVVTRGR